MADCVTTVTARMGPISEKKCQYTKTKTLITQPNLMIFWKNKKVSESLPIKFPIIKIFRKFLTLIISFLYLSYVLY